MGSPQLVSLLGDTSLALANSAIQQAVQTSVCPGPTPQCPNAPLQAWAPRQVVDRTLKTASICYICMAASAELQNPQRQALHSRQEVAEVA